MRVQHQQENDMSYDIYGNNTNALRQEISELQEDLRAYNRQIKRKDEKIQALRAALQDAYELLTNPDADQFDADKVERKILDILSKVEAA
jgi:predicted  nucleic acid-binding Zn-ribbon protein